MKLTRRITNGDMPFGAGLANFAVDSEACAQNVVTRLRMFKGSWFLDTEAGVAYFQDIFVKPSNIPLVEADLKATIIETDDVNELLTFTLVVDNPSRTATLTASANTIYGDTLNIQVTL